MEHDGSRIHSGDPCSAAGSFPDGGAWTGRSLLKASECHVSDVTRLDDASLSYSSLGGWQDRGRLDGFLGLTRSVWRSRAYGDFWSHVLVAEGAVDVAAEPAVSVWDIAAIQVIVEEAGGRFTDLEGGDRIDRRGGLYSNGRFDEEIWACRSR